jgi:hypothetical protein
MISPRLAFAVVFFLIDSTKVRGLPGAGKDKNPTQEARRFFGKKRSEKC